MNRGRANIALLFTAILWGSGNVVQQSVLQHIGPITAVGLRCMIASLIVLPFAWRSGGLSFKLEKHARGWATLTISAFAIALTLLQIGFGRTTVTNASFLVNTASVMTPLCCWLFLRHKPAIVVWIAALSTLIGTCLMSEGSLTAFHVGDILCLLSALSYSIWMVSLGQFVSKCGHAVHISLMQFLATGFVCTIIGLAVEPLSVSGLISAVPHLIFLGVFSTGIGYLLQAIAQTGTTASEASIILSSEAIFGGLGGILVLGERLSLTAIAGSALIFGGIIVMELPFRKMGKILRTQSNLQMQGSKNISPYLFEMTFH